MAKISSLQKGLVFHAPLTDKFLQTATQASDASAYRNHASVVIGTPTYSSSGMELDGTTDYIRFPTTGVFNTTEITIAVRFTPDFDTDEDAKRFIFDCTNLSRYLIIKGDVATSLNLTILLGNTTIANISEATYSPYWNVGVENTIIITSNSTLTNIWLNGNQILTDDSTPWVNDNPSSIYVGSRFSGEQFFDGEIRDLMVWNRLLTAEERAILDATANTNPLLEGLKFYAPLTDKYLEQSGLPSDMSGAGNHCNLANGSPTYSGAGVELNGTTDNLHFPATGVFDTTEITIAFRFTPDFDYDENVRRTLFDSTVGFRYTVVKFDNADSNKIRINLGNTFIGDIAEATYSSFWNVGQENTLIVTGDDTNNLTNAWLNGNLILDNSATAWDKDDPGTLYIGSEFDDGSVFDGHIRDFAVWDRLLDAGDRANYRNLKGILV